MCQLISTYGTHLIHQNDCNVVSVTTIFLLINIACSAARHILTRLGTGEYVV